VLPIANATSPNPAREKAQQTAGDPNRWRDQRPRESLAPLPRPELWEPL